MHIISIRKLSTHLSSKKEEQEDEEEENAIPIVVKVENPLNVTENINSIENVVQTDIVYESVDDPLLLEFKEENCFDGDTKFDDGMDDDISAKQNSTEK